MSKRAKDELKALLAYIVIWLATMALVALAWTIAGLI